jgi:hypothetical protein
MTPPQLLTNEHHPSDGEQRKAKRQEHQVARGMTFRNNSGSFVTLAAIRHASSRVSSLSDD